MMQCFGSGFIKCGSGSSILAEYGSGSNTVRIQRFDEQKWKTFTAEKIFLIKKKIAIYLSLGRHKGRPSYKRSLQPSEENIQHFKT
jgi:hypothetical protein